MARAHKEIASVPLLTVAFVFLSLLSFEWPAMAELLRYDRPAILSGQVWRFFTAPLTHLSWSHLFWNLVAFLIFGSMLEKISRSRFLLICGLIAAVSGVVCFFYHPSVMYYSGASGLISGIVAYLGFFKWVTKDRNLSAWLVILLLLALKIICEIVTRNSLFAIIDMNRVQLLYSSHISGVLVALCFCFCRNKHLNAS